MLWHFVRSPWVSQPDPEKLQFVSAKPKKLTRRGPQHYFMSGKMPDGTEVEIRLVAGAFRMKGLSDIDSPS